MTTVVHHVLDPDGQPVAAKTVTITLMLRLDVAPDSYDLNAPDPFTGAPISRSVSAVSDSNGLLSWDLVPNDQIVPAGTYYEVHGLGGGRTFLYIPASQFPVELSECVLTLVELGSSNLVLVQGPRGRQGGDSTGGLGMPVASAILKGILKLAGDLGGTADEPTVVDGSHHEHTSAQISDASVGTAPGAVVVRDASGQAGFNWVSLGQDPVDPTHAVPKGYADALGTEDNVVNSIVRRDVFGGFGAQYIYGLQDPVSAQDAATKHYVDQGVATRAAIAGDLGGTPANPTVPGLANKSNLGHTHSVNDLTATGTKDSTKFLRGDNTWAVPTAAVKNTTTTLSAPLTDYWSKVEIIDDGSASTSWPNRFEAAYTPVGGTRGLTTYLNEYGELRIEPAKASTVAARFFTKHAPTDAAHTANVWELMDDRTTRTVLAFIDALGNGVFTNLPRKMTVASTAPTSPQTNDVWIDTSA
jgi:hypothetical protein